MRFALPLVVATTALACTTDGNGRVDVTGSMKQWSKVTVTLDGPCAQETGGSKNPFTDYEMNVEFAHESGSPKYKVPGYFAADGRAAETSATSGTKWRAHLSPDKPGRWNYRISFAGPFDGKTGSFRVTADPKARGRLQYVGKHHLRFAGTGEFFLKAGTDSPETLLGYADFDGTETRKTPLKTYAPHVKDWKPGDPTWKDGKGKGLIGALNYLAGKGLNAFSFLTYNAGGDGDNVWPFVSRDDKLHYDVSKLDQWAIVFEHAQKLGLYAHFKLQETENDDQRIGGHERKPGRVPQALDGGALGPERKLYLREMIARFGWINMLNWNLGEENTQSAEEQRAMAQYIADIDPYGHHRVMHTHPPMQDMYLELLGNKSALTGVSLQNAPYGSTYEKTLRWRRASAEAGKPWVVATDEVGSAALGVPPDTGYEGFSGKASDGRTIDDIRKQVLWGNIMAGGAGVEYYFGYQLPQNDLVAEDLRSRDKSWDYARIALSFFRDHKVPFQDMTPSSELVGKGAWCLAGPGGMYLVYLPNGGSTELKVDGSYKVRWFNPRTGGALRDGGASKIVAPNEQDWLAVVTK